MKKYFIALFTIISITTAQEWKHYTTSNSGLQSNLVYAIVIAPDSTVWIGTGNGIASFKRNIWATFDTTNSPLPDPYITALAVDSSNVLWIGTGYAGAAKLQNGVWTLYDTSNSGIPHNTIFDITIGPDQTPWFATEDGVVNFKNNIWKNYKDSLIESHSRSVAFDHHGKLWMGTYTPTDFRGYIEYMKDGVFTHTTLFSLELFSTYVRQVVSVNDSIVFAATGNGLIKFMNGKATVYHMQDSPLPANGVASLARKGDTLIVGTASGVAEIVNNTWNVHYSEAGGLPNDVVYDIAIDHSGNRWYATGSSGIAVYKKGGIATEVQQSTLLPKEFSLFQNYPNPFNPTTVISYQIPVNSHVKLSVYDALGREVASLMNEVKEAGNYSATFNGSKFTSGIYFARLSSTGKTQIKKMMLVK